MERCFVELSMGYRHGNQCLATDRCRPESPLFRQATARARPLIEVKVETVSNRDALGKYEHEEQVQ